ncbi:MAG: ABC transporter permease subunit [Holosporales bacterium]|jgi:putrescine transport system permease protein|nr:ABC transporter permease subunit [Holosporales bacterium]
MKLKILKKWSNGYNIIDPKLYVTLVPFLWMCVFFIMPLLIVLKISFSEAIFSMPPFSDVFSSRADFMLNIQLNFKNYYTILNDSYYMSVFVNSISLSTVATTLCVLLGYPMAYGIYCVDSSRLKSVLILMISLSFWTSFLIRVYSLVNLLNIRGVINSVLIKLGIISNPIQFLGNYFVVCLGFVFCYLPFVILPIYASLGKVKKAYNEAAIDLGCDTMRVFWKITFPLSLPGVLTGCVIVFTASLGEFIIPELLGNANTITFGRALWMEFFTNLDWPMACALSIVMMVYIIFSVYILKKLSESSVFETSN